MDAFFEPESVAVLGASSNPKKLGSLLVENLRSTGYRGNVYPVSRSADRVLGIRAISSLRDIPESPDLVLVSIPAAAVPAAMEDAASVGAKAVVILSCGFAEEGPEGGTLQERVLDIARSSGIRIVGPNCMGVCNLHKGLNGTYFRDLPTKAGKVGVISQSGAFGGVAFARLYAQGIGISKFASIGNMSDVSHAEFISHFGSDNETEAIAAFIEGIPDADELLGVLRKVTPHKPVVILKGGRTATGQAAAASHTGSMAGEGRVWDDLLWEAGASVAEDSEDLFDTAGVLSRCSKRLPSGNRVAIITISGGPSVVAADACERYGLELPNLEDSLAKLRSLVPPFASLRNPVDLTAQMEPSNYSAAVRKVARESAVDALVAVNVGLDLAEFGQAFTEAARNTLKPIVGYVIASQIEAAFEKAGIPNLPSVERAIRAVQRLHDRACQLTRQVKVPNEPRYRFSPISPVKLRKGVLTEHEAKALLAEHGLPVTRERVVKSLSNAEDAAREIGYPIALKVSSRFILHKTDAGAVRLGLQDEEALRNAYKTLADRFPGEDFLVQEMVPSGLELILGGRRDPGTGPVAMIGLGGVFTEVMNDASFCRAPVSYESALAAIARLRGSRLLSGYRGAEPVDQDRLADMLERLAALIVANPGIAEIDLNPVIADGTRIVCVDALIRCTLDRDSI